MNHQAQERSSERKQEFFWRLRYSDGQTLDEPVQDGTIDEAWSNAETLLICHRSGKPVLQIPLREFTLPGRSTPSPRNFGVAPIFYRVKFRDTTFGGVPIQATPQTAAVVFGRAIEEGDTVHVNLWAIVNGRCVDCPDKAIDMTAIERMVTVHAMKLQSNEHLTRTVATVV